MGLNKSRLTPTPTPDNTQPVPIARERAHTGPKRVLSVWSERPSRTAPPVHYVLYSDKTMVECRRGNKFTFRSSLDTVALQYWNKYWEKQLEKQLEKQ